jgi:transcription elongation factor
MRLRRTEEIETLSYRTVVELNAESRLAPQWRVATIARRAQNPNTWPTSGLPAPTAATPSALIGLTAPAPAARGEKDGRDGR